MCTHMLPSHMNIAHKAFHALFSPPRPTPQSETEDHNPKSNQPVAPPAAPRKPDFPHRCQFTYSDRRRCGNERAHFCAHHSSKGQRDFGAGGAPDAALVGLVGLCSDLTTATGINRALAHTYLLMAQGRIS